VRGEIKAEGLYLYCLREKSKSSQILSAKGIDGKEEVFIIPYQGLEAVVSKVSLEEFASEEIKKKAQEDLNWIKEKAVIHEKVVEEAMRKNGKILNLIPMRFGTIFQDKASLGETLNKDYTKIREVLERIRGKQEWSVKVYLKDRRKFEQVIKEKNETIKEKERKIGDLPEGMAFFMEEELKEAIYEELDKELNNIAEGLFADLEKQSIASVKNKILEKELTGRREPMVLNVAYLIPEEKIEDFDKEAQRLNQEIQANGFYLECSGPWPAYNFSAY
jgi:hypothetical protein